jgi:hypothetical protein
LRPAQQLEQLLQQFAPAGERVLLLQEQLAPTALLYLALC